MEFQNQVRQSLRNDFARLQGVLANGVFTRRSEVADRVCEAFGFRDGLGRLQRAGCLKALAEFEAAGRISLPSPTHSGGGAWRPRRLAEPVPPPKSVPEEVGAVEGLELVPVTDDDHRLVWNTMLEEEHPRGAGPLVGCQLRYLVGSAHGWLGAVGFAASAHRLECRDRWIGWSDAGRRACLHRVVCLSRFLVRPGVECRNLASHVLGGVVRRVGDDFEARYGYRPYLLETFVDRHAGTSFQASNWHRIGETAGRGRQDREHAATETPKAVYVYELDADWQVRILEPRAPLAPLEVGSGLDRESWAEQEFGGAPLGDVRLSARLVTCARYQAEAPTQAFTCAARGGLDKGLLSLDRQAGQ